MKPERTKLPGIVVTIIVKIIVKICGILFTSLRKSVFPSIGTIINLKNN